MKYLTSFPSRQIAAYLSHFRIFVASWQAFLAKYNYLPGWKLRVRDWSGEVGGRRHGWEPDDRTVDVGARLPIDEAKEPLASRPQKVVAAVERRVVQRGHVGRTLQHCSQRLTGIRAEVHNRLASIKALDKQQVSPGLQELSGRRRRGG